MLFLCVLAENDRLQVRPLMAGDEHDTQLGYEQLNTAAGLNVVNSICAENATVNGSYVINTSVQSLSNTSDIIKSPSCVIQSVYSLPIQQSLKYDGWENCSVTLPL